MSRTHIGSHDRLQSVEARSSLLSTEPASVIGLVDVSGWDAASIASESPRVVVASVDVVVAIGEVSTEDSDVTVGDRSAGAEASPGGNGSVVKAGPQATRKRSRAKHFTTISTIASVSALC